MKFLLKITAFIFLLLSCQQNQTEKQQEAPTNPKAYSYLNLSDKFKSHWFDGKAEVASYDLTQMRYGEPRQGSAVLIFVKEPFLPQAQVKANTATDKTVDVMKLNYTKKFNTGIYPYSIMQSVFLPLTTQPHAIKVTASTQEWCGQTYMQLNNREQFDIKMHSYFEGEADQELKLDKHLLENEIWVKLRINPTDIPKGKLKIIPDFSFFRLKHQKIKAYKAEISQLKKTDTLLTTLNYQNIDRMLKIYQEPEFPFTILKWQEIDKDTTEATLSKKMRIDYWTKNANQYDFLRDSLNLK
ncbi:septum formation inhibitor Maf [Flavobacterium sp. CS20]|uniref:septum formation inhibitor Maf n=1 Tax=Flavobacterium sp. CS20 TaxID=2775246 RepID=UPI001B3A1F72|nr:septum formation inhibitor Maf [Flavobacterium sp. CS20]QTY25917.1 septum formation inhibitor Maf [Flavobacterium sp. CS20]